MFNNDGLFSESVSERIEATRRYSAKPEPVRAPIGLRGAANALFILIGPSFGEPKSGQQRLPGGPDGRYEDNFLWLGRGIGLAPFDHDGGRHKRWADFLLQSCGSEEIPNLLTSIFNLDWSHQAAESKVPQENLVCGTRVVIPYILKARPRVVVALTNRVYDCVVATLKDEQFQLSPVGSKLTRPVFRLRKTKADGGWIFAKTHNHPSRSFFSREQRRLFGQCVRPFFEDA